MPSYKLSTLADFVAAYGDEEMGKRAFFGEKVLQGEGLSITKTDYPLLTSTSGAYSAVYGPELWAQINLAATTFGALPKIPYPDKFGWRCFTASPTNKQIPSADAGAIADTEIGALAAVSQVPALSYKNFDAGVLQQLATQGGQAVDWATYRDIHGDIFAKGINAALLQNVTTVTANQIQTIDRIVSAFTELSCTDVHADDCDIYSLDRDAGASWADAIVLHASNVDRDFDLSLVNTLARTVEQGCGMPDRGQVWWLTRHDTIQRWEEFLQPQQRFTEGEFKTSAVGGISTSSGKEGAFTLALYQQKPIIVDADVAYDTLGRVYYLNTKYLKLATAGREKYVEAGGDGQSLLLLGKFATEGMFWMAGQPLTPAFFTLGKLRDLQ